MVFLGFPLWAWATGAGLAGAGYVGVKVSDNLKESAEPIKKVAKVGALAGGAYYLRNVAKTTGSPTLKKVANYATVGAVGLIGLEAIKKDPTNQAQVEASTSATDSLANKPDPFEKKEKIWEFITP